MALLGIHDQDCFILQWQYTFDCNPTDAPMLLRVEQWRFAGHSRVISMNL
jgi:hypothetical protein